MDKRMILAIVVSMGVLMMWPYFVGKKAGQEQAPAPGDTAAVAEQSKKETVKTEEETRQKAVSADTKIVSEAVAGNMYQMQNDSLLVSVSDAGGSVREVAFKKYSDDTSRMIRFFGPDVESMSAFGLSGSENMKFKVTEITPVSITLRHDDKNGGIEVRYSVSDEKPYIINTTVTTGNQRGIKLRLLSAMSPDKKEMYGLAPEPEKRIKEFVYFANQKAERTELKDFDKSGILTFSGNPVWYGITDPYFLFAVINSADASLSAGKTDKEGIYFADITPAMPEKKYSFEIYAGPKEVNMLKNANPALTDAIYFGWFTFLSVPMLELLKYFYSLIPNYGLAIIFLTLLIRILLFPLQHKSMKSMKRMQELQPHIKKIQEQYKNDKERMNREVMQFMKTHKVNPMGGCFPMLLQLPVFIALYKVLGSAVELYRSPFIFWLKDLSVKDPYYVLPILMGVMMALQQKMTPNPAMDPTQAKMMMLMPIIFTFFMLSLPSGLTLYIMFSTMLGIAQQLYTNRKKAN